MDGDIHHQSLILPLHDIGDEDEMTAGGDRQKFGDALNKGKDSQMKYRHR